MKANQYSPVAGSSTQQQPTTTENASSAPDTRIMELRLRLDNLSFLLGMSAAFNKLNKQMNNEVDREYKNCSFSQIYEAISELLMNGHIASFIELN